MLWDPSRHFLAESLITSSSIRIHCTHWLFLQVNGVPPDSENAEDLLTGRTRRIARIVQPDRITPGAVPWRRRCKITVYVCESHSPS